MGNNKNLSKILDRLSWKEVIIIAIIGLSFIFYFHENANWYVTCENGSRYQLQEGYNYVCNGRYYWDSKTRTLFNEKYEQINLTKNG